MGERRASSINYILPVSLAHPMARNLAMSLLDWNSSITSVARARSISAARCGALGGFIALVLARGAVAQTPAGDPLAHRLHPVAAAVRPGQYVYQVTLERDAGTTNVGTRTVTVSVSNYAGAPAWLMLETRAADSSSVDTDSLFTDMVSLHPLHWGASAGSARIAAEFRGDTAYGATSGPPGRRSMIATVPAGTFISSAMLETVLRTLPLTATWEDSATTLTASLNGTATLPTRLNVISEDRIQLPAGSFDCWVVAVHAGPTARGLYWVTKQDPIVVRSALNVPSMGGAQLVSALTRIGR
jgi:hypothetical protein